MATLDIGGTKVKVDDAFLSMTPEQQQAAVEEIAAQIGQEQPAGFQRPGQQLQGDMSGRRSSVSIGDQRPEPNILDASLTAIENTIEGIPFAGPLAQRASDFIGTQVGGMMSGRDPAELQAELDARRKARDETYPVTALSGNVTGSIAGIGGLAALPGGTAALGLEGGLLSRIGNSALSGAGISMLDERARGGDTGDVLTQGALGGAIGGAIPGLGAAVKGISRPLVEPIARTIRGAVNPSGEAGKMVGRAIERDRANFAAPVLSSEDQAAARMNNQPILNVDRGGETTRALMRSAANQNPEARATVEKMAEDRYRSQSGRTTDFFRRIMGGNVDDLTRKAEIRTQSRAANDPAYKRAYNDPAARAVWSPEIRQLMQSDSFRAAVKAAESRSTDVAAAQGVKAVRNPFEFRSDGSITLRRNKDGSTALPSLQFWDQVKRELDSRIGTAKRAGDNTTVADLMALKSALVNTLDRTVPAYKQARGTALAFFNAEDAVDAGRKAFASPKAVDESLTAFRSMSKAEQDEFALGMVSQLMDDVRGTNNRNNLTRMFDVPARKELMEAALGKGKAQQFEAFVRVEDIMDKVRGSLGNSTTARQLVELGITSGLGAGAGGASMLVGGDFNTAATTALLVAAGRSGFRNAAKAVDDQVLQKVAQMLASGDEREISKAVANATLSQRHMQALQAIQQGMGVAVRGSAMAAVN